MSASGVVGLSRDQAIRIIRRAAPGALSGALNDRAMPIGGLAGFVNRVVVAPLPSALAVSAACAQPDTLLVTAAPLFWPPLWSLFADPLRIGRVNDLLQARSALLVLSRRWLHSSAAEALAQQLELSDIDVLAPGRGAPLVKLVIFVPEEHVDQVRTAASNAGAGIIGRYSDCSFFSSGTGTFLAGAGAEPAVGSVGNLEHVVEARLEMAAPACDVEVIMEAVRRVHPYEEVAFDACRLENRGPRQGAGRIGRLSMPMAAAELVDRANTSLALTGDSSARCSRAESSKTEWLAVTAGRANESVIRAAAIRGAGAIVCGGLTVNSELLSEVAGISLIDVGLCSAAAPGLAALVRRSAEFFSSSGVQVALVG